MPFINAITNKKINIDKKQELKSGFGTAMSTVGKSENWLMINIQDESYMYFKGRNDFDMIFVEVSIFGNATSKEYSECTEKLTDVISDVLKISRENIYIKYSETMNWGWNGSNF